MDLGVRGKGYLLVGGTSGMGLAIRFSRCNACAALLHPPPPVCRYCRSQDIGVAGVSGRGVVVGVTVNHQLWDPRFPPPFVIATVAIEEDPFGQVGILEGLWWHPSRAADPGHRWLLSLLRDLAAELSASEPRASAPAMRMRSAAVPPPSRPA